MMPRKTAAILTLGCRLNQADSALLCGRLRNMGFDIVPPDSSSSPNLIVVNSCTVTATASRKSRQALKAIRNENPGSFLVMTGCSAVVEQDELQRMNECDLVLTNEQKKDIERILPRYLAGLKPATAGPHPPSKAPEQKIFREQAETLFPFRTRAILKIQEGCENFCSYCIVPYARGPERSRDCEETLEDFQNLLRAGFREIVLSGVNICTYRDGETDLVKLLERLLKIPGDFRLRLSSTEPGPILPRLIRIMAEHPGKICPFLHLPLQHGTDEILKAMGRKYTTEDYAKVAEAAKKAIPNLHLGTDLIAGFPGETDALFRKSCQFLKQMNFANLHLFPFSPRKGTVAEHLPGKPGAEAMTARLESLREIKLESAVSFAKSLLGTEEQVLVESIRPNGICEGWSGNYVRTRFRGECRIGEMPRVRFRKVLSGGALGAEMLKD